MPLYHWSWQYRYLPKKFVFFLNGNIELIKIENKSVDIIEGVAQQRRRDGPGASLQKKNIQKP